MITFAEWSVLALAGYQSGANVNLPDLGPVVGGGVWGVPSGSSTWGREALIFCSFSNIFAVLPYFGNAQRVFGVWEPYLDGTCSGFERNLKFVFGVPNAFFWEVLTTDLEVTVVLTAYFWPEAGSLYYAALLNRGHLQRFHFALALTFPLWDTLKRFSRNIFCIIFNICIVVIFFKNIFAIIGVGRTSISPTFEEAFGSLRWKYLSGGTRIVFW